jgi:predicted nucleic acid-binding protein
MSEVLVISDTSSIILLDKIGEIEMLKMCFDKVYTTPVVAREFGI